MTTQQSFFDDQRLLLEVATEMTVASLRAYGELYPHWAIAYSGGKDSTALVTMVIALIQSGAIKRPETLTVLFSDTRQELPPLYAGAMNLMQQVRNMGFDARVVLPPMDKRYFVYMLGRGVPPPNNGTLRWCTRQIKVEPMLEAIRELREATGHKLLMLTGVRLGESAVRDARILTSCSKDGSECGQGWFQKAKDDAIADTLAPLLHWRVCHIWEWLKVLAPRYGFDTELLADVYGGDEAEEINARTGCIGCPLATKEAALDALLDMPRWKHLQPLTELRPLYRDLRLFKNRLQKDGERKKDGSLSANPNRKGPLTLEARTWALEKVLDVQRRVNEGAAGGVGVNLINAEEEARIRELIAARKFPDRWTGDEPCGDVPLEQVVAEGIVQQLLIK